MFELREALIRQLIFAMENQKIRYLVDIEKGALLREDLVDPEERPDDFTDPDGRYQDIPQWKSADGFFLMERFVSEIQDPPLRDRLQTILLSGSKVFRRFKDTLREAPEVQRRYYRYKYMAMRDAVVEWYNELRGLKGLETLELGADEELHDLLMTDIVFEVLDPVPEDKVLHMDQIGYYEMHSPTLPPEVVDHFFAERRSSLGSPARPHSTVIAASTPEQEIIAFVWITSHGVEGGYTIMTIRQLYVEPEFRGMGVASELLYRATSIADMDDGIVMLWEAGPESPAVKALAKGGGFHSAGHLYRRI